LLKFLQGCSLRHYELVTILSPILSQDQAVEAWDQISNFITTRNGEVTQEQTWGTRRLAYAIQRGTHHFLEGNYRLTRFSTEAPFNQALETFLRLDERVLRSLLVTVKEGGPIPEPVRPVAAPAPTAVAEPATATEATESTESAEVEAAPETEAPSGGDAETPAAVAEAVAEEAPVEVEVEAEAAVEAVAESSEEAEPAEAAVEAVPTAEAEAPAAEDAAPESEQSQA
jgi:small subunit ribosomal protein S6